jgi:hypothetical protein
LLLVRRVRLLLLLPPLRAWPPHRCQVRQGKDAREGADRASPRGLACAAPIHVACALRLFQRPLGPGWAPADGAPSVRLAAPRFVQVMSHLVYSAAPPPSPPRIRCAPLRAAGMPVPTRLERRSCSHRSCSGDEVSRSGVHWFVPRGRAPKTLS